MRLISLFILFILQISIGQTFASCYIGRIIGPRVCNVGSAVFLTDTAAAGRWTSSDTTILRFVTDTGRFVTASAHRMGTVVITYRLMGACSSTFISDTIRVVSGLRGPTYACIGGTTQLAHETSSAIYFSHRWSSSNDSIARVDSISILGNVIGIRQGRVAITHTFRDTSGRLYTAIDSFWVRPMSNIRTHFNDTNVCYYDRLMLLPRTYDTLIWKTGNRLIVDTLSRINDSVRRVMGDSSNYPSYNWRLGGYGATHIYFEQVGCNIHKDSFRVSVNYLPVSISPIRPTTNMCIGDTVTYVAYSSTHTRLYGGYWSVYRYGTIGASSGLFTAVSLGSEWVSYLTYDVFGCYIDAYASFNIYGDAHITGPSVITVNDSATYFNNARSGSDAWSILPGTYGRLTRTTTSLPSAKLVAMWPDTTQILAIDTYCGSYDTKDVIFMPSATTTMGRIFSANLAANICDSISIYNVFLPHSNSYLLESRFGDGADSTIAVIRSSSIHYTYLPHKYRSGGRYTLKQILKDSLGRPIDSLQFYVNNMPCNLVQLSFFKDSNTNCTYERNVDAISNRNKQITIDSAGVRIDTLCLTYGLNYQCVAPSGTVFTFSPIDTFTRFNCASGGSIRHTITSTHTAANSYQVSIVESPRPLDVSQYSRVTAGRHTTLFNLVGISNDIITTPATIVLKHSNRDELRGCSPAATSTTDTTITWNVRDFSSLSNFRAYVHLEISGTWRTPGSLVNNRIMVDSFSRTDIDPTNNQNDRWDTVISSYDPNFIQPTPAGKILNSTRVQYFIQFENDGNDTARNIFVMDTLDDNLDMSTFQLIGATAPMYTQYFRSGGRNIIKFGFPNINLPDSSHHGLCMGNVIYSIKPLRSRTNFTPIKARVGIYFDDSEVVMTPEASNTVIIPGDTISSRRAGLFCEGDSLLFSCNYLSVSNTQFQWLHNGARVGTNSPSYTASSLASGDSVKCRMLSIQQDTVTSMSNVIVVSYQPRIVLDTIVGRNYLCDTNSMLLTNATSGGNWSVVTGRARISSTGILQGITHGLDTALYIKNNVCYGDTVAHPVVIRANVPTSIRIAVTPSDSVCSGLVASFTSTITNGGASPRYRWRRMGTVMDTSASYAYLPALGDLISCELLSSELCPLPTIAASNAISMLVIPTVTPRVDVISIPADSVTYIGQVVNYFASVSYSGSAPNYQWYLNGTPVSGATNNNFTHRAYNVDSIWCSSISDVACATTTNAISSKIAVYVPTLSLQSIAGQNHSIAVYPNPNNGNFTLKSLGAKTHIGNYLLEIRDVLGVVVYRSTVVPQANALEHTFNLSHLLGKGNYWLRCTGNDITEHLQFIID